MYDVVIIGGGPAGLTSAVYAGRAGLSVLVLESTVCGGQIVNSQRVDNFPSRSPVPGWQLADEWQNQARSMGAVIKYSEVKSIEENGDFKNVRTARENYDARAVIIANGAVPRRMDCSNADKFIGHGISTCATCDGAFFRGRSVAVVGGGNTAFEDALYLAAICSSVYLINRRQQFRADASLVESVSSKDNVTILVPYIPFEVLGDSRVTGFLIRNTETNEILELDVAGIFTAIGMIPDNYRFGNVAELDSGGYIVTDEMCRTRTPGIFAAGDTRVKSLRQLVTAASDGAVAATEAISYINTRKE